VFLLEADRVGDLFGEREYLRENVLGDDRSVHLTSVGEEDVALDKLGIHELVHSGRGRVNPAQFPGVLDLIGEDRPGDEYLCVCHVAVEVGVGGKVHDFDLRKFALELFR
jgi:hypothetical protein